MKTIYTDNYDSPVGELILGSYDDKVCLCDWRYRNKRASIDKRISSGLDAVFTEQKTPIHELARKQLDEYFKGERNEFALPLLPVGSAFQKRVWHALTHIPFGQTLSYNELTGKIGDEGAIRAVAAANGANGLAIIIPCHRVVGTNGKLVGYAGGKQVKQKLLELELGQKQGQLFS